MPRWITISNTRGSFAVESGGETRRRLLGSILLATLLVISGTALATEETTTTTTTTPETSTTTVPETSTTTPDATTTTLDAPGTTTNPSTTTTTLGDGDRLESTTTTTPNVTSTTAAWATTTTVPEDSSELPEAEVEAVDFRVGRLPAPHIVFPVLGPHSFVDTFGAPRDGGSRRHAGIDIMAARGVPVVSVAAGVVERMGEGSLAGQYVVVRHDNGWRSKYVHLDNDTPGTDDGRASGFAKGLHPGMRVQPGTVIGFVGDSGNSERTVPHLHFGLFQPNGLPVNPYRALVAAPAAGPTFSNAPAETFNTELIGHIVPAGRGFNSDIAVNGDYVYVGTSGNSEVCPGTGVRIIDVSNPTEPAAVAAVAGANQFPGTATSSLWVGKVRTNGFHGVLAVVGVRLCDEDDRASVAWRFAGLALYDVTVPSHPVLLTTVHSGDGTAGVSDVDLTVDGDRLLAAVTVPQSYTDHAEGLGDVRIYDLTRIFDVREESDWDFRRDGPPLLVEGLGAFLGDEALAATSVSWDHSNRLVVSHSAAGVVTLDVSRVTGPAYLSSTAANDFHRFLMGSRSSVFPNSRASQGSLFGDSLLIQNDYRLQPGFNANGELAAWSRQRIFDVTDPATPRLVSSIGISNGDENDAAVVDGIYSPRASVAIGDHLQLVTWLSGGVRVIDLNDPSKPKEVAFFVPPASPDPYAWWIAPDNTRELALAYDVATDGEFVYLSDVNSGLWIFRLTIPVVERTMFLPR